MLVRLPVLSARSCTKRSYAFTRFLGCILAFVSFLNDPCDHQELTYGTHGGIPRPLQDVEAVYSHECFVFRASVPAEAVVVDCRESDIPFPWTDSESIEIDHDRLAAEVMQYVPYARIAMNDSLRQCEAKARIPAMHIREHLSQKAPVFVAQPVVIRDSL